MNDVTVAELQEWFRNHEDVNYLYELELEYSSVGDTIELSSLPEGYSITVKDLKLEREYSSYGYQNLHDGYIILTVKDSESKEKDFKIPVTYASFEGWGYEIDNIVPAVRREQTITTYEWV